jgi:hypothetical protein
MNIEELLKRAKAAAGAGAQHPQAGSGTTHRRGHGASKKPRSTRAKLVRARRQNAARGGTEKKSLSPRPDAQDAIHRRRRPTPPARPISDRARRLVQAVEAEALRAGWKPAQLWSNKGRPDQIGLAALLAADDEIGEVRTEFIEVRRRYPNGHISVTRLYNPTASRRWSRPPEEQDDGGK